MAEKGWDLGTADMDRVREVVRELRDSLSAQGAWSAQIPQEIRSGAIMLDENAPGCYVIEANTARGLREFQRAEEVGGKDPQSEDYPFFTTHRVAIRPWRELFQLCAEAATSPRRQRTRQPVGDPDQPSPHEVLATLAEQATLAEVRRRMVIEAEVLAFPTEQIPELHALLHRFIEEHRHSDDPEVLVAVGSAIRKYVATMDRDEVGALALLLDARHNAAVPLEVEVEVVKTLVRKLSANPPNQANTEPELGDRLMDLARAYLNPRLLSRQTYPAVALNAVLASALLRSRHTADLVCLLENLGVPWFSELVSRRASRIRSDIAGRFSETEAKSYPEALDALCGIVAPPAV